jgi:hypothetical protein
MVLKEEVAMGRLLLTKDFITKHHIILKKIPREIARF